MSFSKLPSVPRKIGYVTKSASVAASATLPTLVSGEKRSSTPPPQEWDDTPPSTPLNPGMKSPQFSPIGNWTPESSTNNVTSAPSSPAPSSSVGRCLFPSSPPSPASSTEKARGGAPYAPVKPTYHRYLHHTASSNSAASPSRELPSSFKKLGLTIPLNPNKLRAIKNGTYPTEEELARAAKEDEEEDEEEASLSGPPPIKRFKSSIPRTNSSCNGCEFGKCNGKC
jgi:hypothetical protein